MQHTIHASDHSHIHGNMCGHIAVEHEGHVDYLHEGHLHFRHGDHYDEHAIAVSSVNPATCAPMACNCDHQALGHEQVPHGSHYDYLCNGQLHHGHGDHCDNHGSLTVH
ncbi:MAG: hypothetical protein ACRDHW_14450 [Ktedonobacteraceae bacterium]